MLSSFDIWYQDARMDEWTTEKVRPLSSYVLTTITLARRGVAPEKVGATASNWSTAETPTYRDGSSSSPGIDELNQLWSTLRPALDHIRLIGASNETRAAITQRSTNSWSNSSEKNPSISSPARLISLQQGSHSASTASMALVTTEVVSIYGRHRHMRPQYSPIGSSAAALRNPSGIKKPSQWLGLKAERVGFEPTVGLHPRWFSRPEP